MKLSFLSTGTELLKGSAVNTNLAFLGGKLTAAGMPLAAECAADDHPGEIAGALSYALSNSDTVILCGGLGPTSDDITLDVTARFFGLELHTDPRLKEKVASFWARIHEGPCPKRQFRQARLPEGGEAMDNPRGSAAGIAFSALYAGRERHIFLLPGPPSEFEPMVENELLPRLEKLRTDMLHTFGCLVAGTGESTVAAAVEPALRELRVEIAYCAVSTGTRLFVSSPDRAEALTGLERARALLGGAALPPGVLELPEYLLTQLRAGNLTFGCAESCTGGLAADAIVKLPGASDVFRGGIVAYHNEVKHALLNVSAETLERHGAVSGETAAEMALGACRALGCDCAISTTGVAGPGGGTPEKPVGLVWIAAVLKGKVKTCELHLRGGREAIRTRAAGRALLLLSQMLQEKDA